MSRLPKLTGCQVLPPMHAKPKRLANGHSNAEASGATSGKSDGKPSRNRGRWQALNHFADCTMAPLSRGEIAVWLILYRDTKPNGLARVSQADLARRAGADDRTVRRALRRLTKAKLLSVVRRGGLRRGPSTYRVHAYPPSGSGHFAPE
jgi:hypothetical protein